MINRLIIGSESSNLYTTKRLLIEGQKLKLESSYLNPYCQHIDYHLKSKLTNTLYMARTTGIKFDEFDIHYANFLKLNGATISNPLKSLPNFRSKDSQYLFFLTSKFNTITSLSFRGELDESKWNSIKQLSKNQEYIIKTIRGNGGIGVMLVRGMDSLKSILETFTAMKDQRFLIQPFLKHKKEWRVFLTKNKTIAVIEKQIDSNDFRGNSKRSKGKILLRPAKKLIDLSEKIFLNSGLDYAGLDLMEIDDELKILEVNAVPGFKQIEELSKLNVARELLLEIIKDNQKH